MYHVVHTLSLIYSPVSSVQTCLDFFQSHAINLLRLQVSLATEIANQALREHRGIAVLVDRRDQTLTASTSYCLDGATLCAASILQEGNLPVRVEKVTDCNKRVTLHIVENSTRAAVDQHFLNLTKGISKSAMSEVVEVPQLLLLNPFVVEACVTYGTCKIHSRTSLVCRTT